MEVDQIITLWKYSSKIWYRLSPHFRLQVRVDRDCNAIPVYPITGVESENH